MVEITLDYIHSTQPIFIATSPFGDATTSIK